MTRSTRTHAVIISTGYNCQSIQHMLGQDGFRCDNLPHFKGNAAVIKKIHFVLLHISFLKGFPPLHPFFLE